MNWQNDGGPMIAVCVPYERKMTRIPGNGNYDRG